VRKQLFIVRTSGARLLALINDVMDAATLRQARLVLKQERLELRQVVGDVVDLTRSLVSFSVAAGFCPGCLCCTHMTQELWGLCGGGCGTHTGASCDMYVYCTLADLTHAMLLLLRMYAAG
jgi:signal transduction histidine kinase